MTSLHQVVPLNVGGACITIGILLAFLCALGLVMQGLLQVERRRGARNELCRVTALGVAFVTGLPVDAPDRNIVRTFLLSIDADGATGSWVPKEDA